MTNFFAVLLHIAVFLHLAVAPQVKDIEQPIVETTYQTAIPVDATSSIVAGKKTQAFIHTTAHFADGNIVDMGTTTEDVSVSFTTIPSIATSTNAIIPTVDNNALRLEQAHAAASSSNAKMDAYNAQLKAAADKERQEKINGMRAQILNDEGKLEALRVQAIQLGSGITAFQTETINSQMNTFRADIADLNLQLEKLGLQQ